MPISEFSAPQRYGPLQATFEFLLPDGYTALVGRNNSGKSAILQMVFRGIMDDEGGDGVCLILADRPYVATGMDVGGETLGGYNNTILQRARGQPTSYEENRQPFAGDLAKLLLAHGDNHYTQKQALDELMARFGFSAMTNRAGASLLDQVNLQFQGAGFRQVYPILAALTDSSLHTLLIDEPEAGLEPALQRVLRATLVEYGDRRRILVATHSHLMIDREKPSRTLVVEREAEVVSVRALKTDDHMADTIFRLLGNSTEDLLLPGAFVVVEGASDQAIVEAAKALLQIPAGRVKVISCGGVSRAQRIAEAIAATLTPLVTRDSPYRERVVCLIDQPTASDLPVKQELERHLGDRLFVLPEASIEQALPEGLFVRAGLTKAAELASIALLHDDRNAEQEYKRKLSQALALNLEFADVEGTPIEDVLRRAAAIASPTTPGNR